MSSPQFEEVAFRETDDMQSSIGVLPPRVFQHNKGTVGLVHFHQVPHFAVVLDCRGEVFFAQFAVESAPEVGHRGAALLQVEAASQPLLQAPDMDELHSAAAAAGRDQWVVGGLLVR